MKIGGKVANGKAYKLNDEYVCFESNPTIYDLRLVMIAKCRSPALFLNALFLVTGPATMESGLERTIGTLDEQGFWIGGKLIMSKESGAIKYEEYDENGEYIPESTRHYHSNEWVAVAGNRCSQCCGDIPRKSRKI